MCTMESRCTIKNITKYVLSEATIFDLQKRPCHMNQPDIKRDEGFQIRDLGM